MSETMTQTAPYPHDLAALVDECEYRRGWRVKLVDTDRGQGSKGLTLIITAIVQDSLNQDELIGVNHLFIVPAASYNRRSWMRWLLDRFLDVESHEACEYFRIGGERVYAPHHSEGEDPYTIFEIGDFETANKRFTDR
jgi:hypothetical protein